MPADGNARCKTCYGSSKIRTHLPSIPPQRLPQRCSGSFVRSSRRPALALFAVPFLMAGGVFAPLVFRSQMITLSYDKDANVAAMTGIGVLAALVALVVVKWLWASFKERQIRQYEDCARWRNLPAQRDSPAPSIKKPCRLQPRSAANCRFCLSSAFRYLTSLPADRPEPKGAPIYAGYEIFRARQRKSGKGRARQTVAVSDLRRAFDRSQVK